MVIGENELKKYLIITLEHISSLFAVVQMSGSVWFRVNTYQYICTLVLETKKIRTLVKNMYKGFN